MATTDTNGSVSATLSQDDISKLYVAIFNRASEGEGNKFWQSVGETDVTAEAMLDSEAAKKYFGDALDDNKAFIEHIYKNTLGKTMDDDAEGIEFWSSLLDGGKSRGEVVSSLIDAVATGDFSGDAKAMDAQLQFNNRVEVSNKMADSVFKVVDNYEVASAFDGELKVTADSASVDSSFEKINSFVGDVSGSFSWASEEGAISADVQAFLDDIMPEIETDFSAGIESAMESYGEASLSLQADIDKALENLEKIDDERADTIENVLSFLDSVEVESSLDASIGELEGSLALDVKEGNLSADVGAFLEDVLPDLKADLAGGVDVGLENLSADIKSEIDVALSNDELSDDIKEILSLFGNHRGSVEVEGSADADGAIDVAGSADVDGAVDVAGSVDVHDTTVDVIGVDTSADASADGAFGL